MNKSLRVNRERLLVKAREIANLHGWHNLTLNLLASELGIKPPSLYNHIEGLPGLQRDLRVEATRDLVQTMMQAAVGKEGGAACIAIGHAYRNFALANPGLLPAIAAAPAEGDEEHKTISDGFVTVGLAVLSAYGFDRKTSIHALRSLRSLVHGFVALELEGGFGLPEEVSESFQWALDLWVTGLEKKA